MSAQRSGRIRRTAWGAAALALVGVVAVGGCGRSDGGTGRTSRSAAPSAAPSPTATTAAAVQRFASVTIPAGATDVRIVAQTTAQDTPQYQVRFTTTEKQADAFCSGNQLGGPLVYARSLDAATKKKYGIEGGSKQKPRTCGSVVNGSAAVQRDVLVTYPGGGKAVVHLVAYELRG